jgi:hypothetical protein
MCYLRLWLPRRLAAVRQQVPDATRRQKLERRLTSRPYRLIVNTATVVAAVVVAVGGLSILLNA